MSSYIQPILCHLSPHPQLHHRSDKCSTVSVCCDYFYPAKGELHLWKEFYQHSSKTNTCIRCMCKLHWLLLMFYILYLCGFMLQSFTLGVIGLMWDAALVWHRHVQLCLFTLRGCHHLSQLKETFSNMSVNLNTEGCRKCWLNRARRRKLNTRGRCWFMMHRRPLE